MIGRVQPFGLVPLESNGILYLKLMFDISAVPQELLPYTGLLTELLGKLDMEKYSLLLESRGWSRPFI